MSPRWTTPNQSGDRRSNSRAGEETTGQANAAAPPPCSFHAFTSHTCVRIRAAVVQDGSGWGTPPCHDLGMTSQFVLMLIIPSVLAFVGGVALWNASEFRQGSTRQLTRAAAVAMLVVGGSGFAVATLLA